MIQIILKDGRKYFNEEELGTNLDSKEEILECLKSDGIYMLCTETLNYIAIGSSEIQEIIEY